MMVMSPAILCLRRLIVIDRLAGRAPSDIGFRGSGRANFAISDQYAFSDQLLLLVIALFLDMMRTSDAPVASLSVLSFN